MSASVDAAAPTGSLSCASSTSNSITIGVSYANTGSSAAKLYRYGAPGNGQIASYPGPSGSGRHVDTGLSGSYRYQLRTGTTVLANVECVTKPVQAPTPTPSPAPTPPVAAPVRPTPTAASPSLPIAVPPTAPTPIPSEEEFVIEELPPAELEQDTEEPIITAPTDANAKGPNIGLLVAGSVGVLLLLAAGLYRFFTARRQMISSATNPPRGNLDALSVPSVLPSPLQNPAVSTLPVPPAIEVPSPQTARFDRSIDKAFYPSRTVAATTLVDDKAHEIPDMYTVANEHPESFGNVNYSPVIKDQPPAGPSTDNTLDIRNRTIVSEPPAILKISH